ncbi:sterol desaturase family protein [Planktothrix agardhii]|jgi:sterol desaturase/sphingolipid hydroxylase (fatty acid hydroxylase superfamily)|uniref:sterol desaturase family protein n=3 Tax=Planktothrix agardhii TaxID=1160 RepID=UPI002B21E85F|nr:sterol desaturase family protein [Planktothrix agardhii]
MNDSRLWYTRVCINLERESKQKFRGRGMELIIGLSTIFVSGALLSIWEIKDPIQRIEYRSQFLKDLIAAILSLASMLIVAYVSLPVVKLIVSPSILESPIWTTILSLPLWIRLIVAYILRDFSFYLMHWAMHASSFLWPAHRWHHSIRHVWWLSGKRTSLTCWLLYRFAPLWFLLLEIPPEIMILSVIHAGIHDNWVHLNVKPRAWMSVIEWVLVTPRYHRIHHYHPEGKNMGSIFTFFDRLFGTYVNPQGFDFNNPELDFIEGEIEVKSVLGI